MGALARFLVAFAALLLAHGQEEAHTSEGFSVESQHATEMHEDELVADHASEEHEEAAEPAPVQEGSLSEYFEDKFHEAEESVAEVVTDVEEAAESFENEVSGAVGGEPDIDEDHHAEEHSLEEEAHEHEEEQDISSEHHSEEQGHHLEEGEEGFDRSGTEALLTGHHLEEQHGFDEKSGFDEHHPEEEDASKRHPFLEYNGQLDQHADMHKEMLTLTKAKEWCAEHSQCMGFYHTGAADEGPFEMTFKDHWELNSEHEEHDPHTAYKKWVGVDLLDAGAPHGEALDDVSHEVAHEGWLPTIHPDEVQPASVPQTDNLRGSMSYHEA